MQKINDWENVEASKDFESLPVGAYAFKIVTVEDKVSQSGKSFLEIKCDVAEGEFKGFASGNEKALRRMRAFYNTPKTNGLFKRFTDAIESCNRGFKWNWDEQKLVGKVFYAVLVGHEYINNDNKVVVGTEINYVSTMNKEKFDKGDYKVPEIERLDPSSVPAVEDKEYTPFSNANSDSVPF